MTDAAPVIVLDDDPTGTQAVVGASVLLEWDAGLLARAVAGAPAVHLLTNSRALGAEDAYAVVADAARTVREVVPAARLLLRGDSTLRGHLLEEYRAVRDTAFSGAAPPLLLVPALPAAGRVTVGGTHLLERDGIRIPLHETEYAADPAFGYRDANLLRWAEERSGGFFARDAGREVLLDALRSEGPGAVATALIELVRAGVPAVCAPDAETVDDLALIASGLDSADRRGARVVVRCGPTFVGVVAGNLARRHVPPPAAGRGLLVVCGSYVPSTTRQLEALVDQHPGVLVELDAAELASGAPGDAIRRASAAARASLAGTRLAVIATSRTRYAPAGALDAVLPIAQSLARAAAEAVGAADVVLAKGGITSHTTARDGLGARSARVAGPIADGVALWELDAAQGPLPYVVFPGNVGAATTLRDVVDLILATRPTSRRRREARRP